MRWPLSVSVLLHLAVVLLTLYGLPRILDERIVEDSPMIVELVKIDERTVQRTVPKAVAPPEPTKPPPARLAEKPPEPKVEQARPAPQPAPAPTPPTQQAAPPPPPPAEAPKLAMAPPPPQPKPTPPAPAPKPEPAKTPPPPEPAKPSPARTLLAAMPQPKTKPQPPKPEPKEQPLDLDRIAALLDKRQPKAAEPQRPEPQPAKQEQVRVQQSPSIDQPLSMTVIDSIRKQISDRWSLPAGARDADSLTVTIRVELQEDGSVLRAEIVGNPRLASDSFYRAAADSALRAVKLASPLKNLPLDRFQQWRELTLNFNPKEMLGG